MNNTKSVKIKTIYNQKLAGYLMLQGFVLVDMQQNRRCNGKNVFYFNESPDLLKAMNLYLSQI